MYRHYIRIMVKIIAIVPCFAGRNQPAVAAVSMSSSIHATSDANKHTFIHEQPIGASDAISPHVFFRCSHERATEQFYPENKCYSQAKRYVHIDGLIDIIVASLIPC